jgi:hypothetical protein
MSDLSLKTQNSGAGAPGAAVTSQSGLGPHAVALSQTAGEPSRDVWI